jgi:hypothetical protein
MSSFSDSDFDLEDVEEGTSVAQVSAQPFDATAFVPPVVVKPLSSEDEDDMGDMDDFEDESEDEEEEGEEASQDSQVPQGQDSPGSLLNVDQTAKGVPGKSTRMPVLNRDTANPYTYDTDYLLDPKSQERVTAAHRFSKSIGQPEKSKSVVGGKDYIRQNIASTKIRVQPVRQAASVLTPGIAQFLAQKNEPPREVDVQGRFYDKAAKTEEKKAKLKVEREQEQLSQCTFKPEIISKKQSRTFQDFITENYSKDKLRQDKVNRLREEREIGLVQQDEFSHKPTLCEKSLKMRKETTEPVHLKLYNSAKSHVQKQIDANHTRAEADAANSTSSDASFKPFTPQLNKRSQELVREGRIDELLYADALRRTESHRASVSTHSKVVKEKFITSASDNLLRGKLLAEYAETFEALESEGRLNYTQFRELMTRMRFLSTEAKESKVEQDRTLLLELWKELAGDHPDIEKSRLEGFLLNIMGFDMVNDQGESVTGDGKSLEEVHLKYFALYENRNYGKGSKAPVQTESHSFRPKINARQRTRRPDSQPATGRLEDDLIREGGERQKRLEILRNDTKSKQLQDCTFKPTINQKAAAKIGAVEHKADSQGRDYIELLKTTNPKYHTDRLYELAKKSNEKLDAKSKEAETKRQEDQSKDCTFKPDRSLTTTQLNVKQRDLGEVPGSEEIIHRIKKGRAEKEWNKSMTERGSDSGITFSTGVQYKTKGKGSFDALLRSLPKAAPQISYLESLARHREQFKFSAPSLQMDESAETQGNVSVPKPNLVGASLIKEPEVKTVEFTGLRASEISAYSPDASISASEEPLLTITVNLSPTLSDQLVVYSFTEVDQVVDAFVLKNCKDYAALDEAKKTQLKAMLNQHLMDLSGHDAVEEVEEPNSDDSY